MMASESVVEENHFDRLPTELIISIFEKIKDAKCLCICYSVSKHFAAHVVRTHSVSVRISCAIGPFVGLPVWPPGITNFLKKLRYVESAKMQFYIRNLVRRPSRSSSSRRPSVRWKSDSFVFNLVFAQRSFVGDDTSGRIKAFTVEECNAFFGSIHNHLCDFELRFRYIEELIALLPNLKDVSAVDSLKRGSIVLEEQGINNVRRKKMNRVQMVRAKLWFAHEVKLPFSRRIMENVVFMSTRPTDGSEAENPFQERHYPEIAITMMKKSHEYFSLAGSALGPCTVADFSVHALERLESLSFWRCYRLCMAENPRNNVA